MLISTELGMEHLPSTIKSPLGKVISLLNFSQKEEGLAGGTQQALVNQEDLVAGVRFELTTFGL